MNVTLPRLINWIIIGIVLLTMTGCTTNSSEQSEQLKLPNATTDPPPAVVSPDENPEITADELLSQMRAVPAHSTDSYPEVDGTALADRVGDIPDFVLNFMREYDSRPDYEEYQLTAEDERSVMNALENLPPLTRQVLAERLLGIYFIEDFLGNGLCDFVFAPDGEMYVYMVFNPRGLKTNISELLTEKENSCFTPVNGGFEITIDCGETYSGWQYILLHESTHAVDYVKTITPYVEEAIQPLQRESEYSGKFIDEIWETYNRPVSKFDFNLRQQITFYGFGDGPKMMIPQSIEAYRQRELTPFVSLYASRTWPEDLAELVALYHLTEKMGQPYTITVTQLGHEKYSGQPMESELVRERFSLVEEIFY